MNTRGSGSPRDFETTTVGNYPESRYTDANAIGDDLLTGNHRPASGDGYHFDDQSNRTMPATHDVPANELELGIDDKMARDRAAYLANLARIGVEEPNPEDLAIGVADRSQRTHRYGAHF